MRVSVVVRTYNSARTLRECLNSVLRQSVDCELVVVDSGSSDGTLGIVQDLPGVKLVEMQHEDFTFGRALNLGFAASSGDVIMALSSHCSLSRPDHVAICLNHLADARVAAAAGARADFMGRRLDEALAVSTWPMWPFPWWGFTNHANAIRRSVWQETRFDEAIVACEDKAWAARVHGQGFNIVYDPALSVNSDHRRGQGIRRLYRRGRNEGFALQQLLLPRRLSAAHLLRYRFVAMQGPSRLATMVRWLSPYRSTEVLGLIAGTRSARRRHKVAMEASQK